MLLICFVLLGFVLLAVQTSLLGILPNWFGRPDLLFILLAFVSYRFDWLRGLFLAFFLGWLLDVASGQYVGMYPIVYISTFIALKFLTENSPVRDAAYEILLLGCCYFLTQFLVFSCFYFVEPDALPQWPWGRIVQGTVILVIAALPSFYLFNSLYEHMRHKRLLFKGPAKSNGNRFR